MLNDYCHGFFHWCQIVALLQLSILCGGVFEASISIFNSKLITIYGGAISITPSNSKGEHKTEEVMKVYARSFKHLSCTCTHQSKTEFTLKTMESK